MKNNCSKTILKVQKMGEQESKRPIKSQENVIFKVGITQAKF
jgi:hypothetical protein